MTHLPEILGIAGCVALLIGIFGGGVKAKEIEVPKISTLPRILSCIIGGLLIGVSIWLFTYPPIPIPSIPTETVTPGSISTVSAFTPIPSDTPAQTTSSTVAPPPTHTATATSEVQTPEGFLRHYFSLVTDGKDYDLALAWYLLTPKFQKASDSGGYDEYTAYWKSIRQVDVNSVEVEPLSSTSVNCLTDLTFHTMSGMTNNITVTYRLVYDKGKKTWMFDSP
jgi:hypothetical protein